MTISDAQYAAWLDNSTAQRVTLYRVNCVSNGVPTTRYLSNKPYVGSAATPYMDCIAKDLEISQSIAIDGAAKLSAGTIDVHNVSGELDSWLGDIWVNQNVQVLVGDATWAESDFRLSFVGALADIAPGSTRFLLTFNFRDKLQDVNTPVSDLKMSNNVLFPVALGEVPNMTPLYEPANGRWYYHCGPSEGMIEPRTDGKKRSADITDDSTNGRFVFNDATGPGVLTCSVQGDKTGGVYRNTIASLVQLLVTSYGKASTRLSASDIDATNFAAFDAANPQPVGLLIPDRTNVIDACAQLAVSKGAQLIPSMVGKLRLLQYVIPSTATLTIPRSMQVQATLVPVTRSTVAASVCIGFCQNYTVEANLQTSIPDAHKSMFAMQWQSYTAVDVPTQTAYNLYATPVQINTCLLKQQDAIDEANRRLAIVKAPHMTYQVELTPAGLLVQLGEARMLYSDRFGLQAGKPGLVTSLTVNFGTYHTVAQITV